MYEKEHMVEFRGKTFGGIIAWKKVKGSRGIKNGRVNRKGMKLIMLGKNK